MNKSLKVVLVTIVAAMIMLLLTGGAIIASAEKVVIAEPPVTEIDDGEGESTGETVLPETPSGETEEEQPTEIEELAANFVGWLKSTFGEDYEYYYNQIIEAWGSIENYLTQFGEEKLPEQYQSGWQEFISFLDEYAVVWAPILAIAAVIIIFIIGKKKFTAAIDKAVDRRTAALGNEMNKQSKAQTAVMHGIKALCGNNAKFADTVKELDESEKELNSSEKL